MFLHRNFKKILAVVLSMAIVLSGISFVFNSGTGSKVRFGEEARGANEYTTLTKSDGSTVQIPVQTYNADTNGDGIGDTAYKYVEITESGTWTPPNTKLVDVFLIGGGGGGGYGYYHGGGGGGSGYSTKAYNASVAGSVAISIGAGGAPREPSNMSAGYVIPSGGTTTFISGSTNIQALGGAGGDYLDGGIGGSNGGNGGNGGGSGSERNGQPGEAGKAVDFLGRVHGGGGGGGSAGQNYGGKGGAGQVNGSGKISADLVYFSPFYSSYCGTGGGGYGGGGGGTSSAMRHESVSGWGYYGGFGGQGFCMVRWLSNNAPAILSTSFQQNQVLSETDTNFISRIAASDIDNDTLTCKYYIDSESSPRDIKTMVNSNVTQTVAFSPVDISPLGEGNHTIRFEVEDGKVGKPTTQIMNFKVDKSAPIIGAITGSSSINSITLSGSATDSIGGLDANPYRYTVGSNVSPWGSGTTYTSPGNLVSNMLYEAKFEARDLSGHIAVSTKNIYTKADMPVLSVTNPSSYALEVVTSDNNSDATQYQFSVNGGTKYVTQEGTLTSAPAWITLTGKKVTVTGLTPNQTYSFTAKARNAENIETAISAAASGTTLIAPPGSPANIIATATDKTITVSWDGVSGAIGYDVWVDGSVVNNDTATVFTHANLNPGTPHTYKVRARNAGGPGNWSSPVIKSTLPGSPDIPVNLNAIPLSSSVTITWNNVPGATGYDVEVDGKVVNNGPNTNYIHNSLTSGTHHSYRVRSINPGGKSEWSGYVNTTTLLETVAVPVNFSAVPSVGDITLSWD
ncbi:MAG TPA: fibronectin type III domain-containing protein, partial [Ruminiclostridium sp.]|nr:fibronectin type III domain-containing protein [Ruminiclostridium sp.]